MAHRIIQCIPDAMYGRVQERAARHQRGASDAATHRTLVALAILALSASCARRADRPSPDPGRAVPHVMAFTMDAQTTGLTARLIGLSAVSDTVAWIAGTDGTWGRTVNGGRTWESGVVSGAESLQFRDVHAVDATTAYLLSIGEGPDSRVYKTTDGGSSWTLQFTNDEPEAFYDCFAFWDAQHGIAFSDAVDGAFPLIATDDGGATWSRLPTDRLPAADDGEGSFAASGTCLIAFGDSTALFGTGAAAEARVFRTDDRGRSWTAVTTPIAHGTPTTGITSLAFESPMRGAVFGGDVGDGASELVDVAVTENGGRTWAAAPSPPFPGAVYGAAVGPEGDVPAWIAVGPGGMAMTTDRASHWISLDTLAYWSVAFGSPRTAWAVGPNGRVTRIRFTGRELR